jgi:hypothetical protein
MKLIREQLREGHRLHAYFPADPPPCWGCYFGVPLRDGQHEEPAQRDGKPRRETCTRGVATWNS